MRRAADRRNCREVRERLYEYLDGELTPERSAAVRSHLERCADCFALTRFEEAFLRFLEARAEARTVPPALRRRILERLLPIRGDERPEPS